VAPLIDRSITVSDLLDAHPAAGPAFTAHGMACVGCPMARFETLEEVAAAYAIDLGSFLRQIVTLTTGSPADSRRLRKRKDTHSQSRYR
jgi:hybrid cluster-associated redox disulfide protein